MGPRKTAKQAQAVDAASNGDIDAEAVLNALALPVTVIDEAGAVAAVNASAEQFYSSSAGVLIGQPLTALLPANSPVFQLIDQVRESGNAVSEYGIGLESPRIGRHLVNLQASPIPERPGWVVLAMLERSIADKIDRQLTHRGAARSVTGMAALMAHEVKNPLSGIRGAAQLLEENAAADDRTLTRLIRDETDRICAIVDRMEVFSDSGPLDPGPVNIHEVLDRVQKLAENGFGRHVRFLAQFDPSLPPVLGSRDQLVQVFLNLVKNAAEAVPPVAGEIQLSTAYRHGLRFAVVGSDSRVHLPIMVQIRDNGTGIPDDLKPHLFDPFVTTKPHGSGLGLALVAKMVGDHGGVIEIESEPGNTWVRVMLPVAPAHGQDAGQGGGGGGGRQ